MDSACWFPRCSWSASGSWTRRFGLLSTSGLLELNACWITSVNVPVLRLTLLLAVVRWLASSLLTHYSDGRLSALQPFCWPFCYPHSHCTRYFRSLDCTSVPAAAERSGPVPERCRTRSSASAHHYLLEWQLLQIVHRLHFSWILRDRFYQVFTDSFFSKVEILNFNIWDTSNGLQGTLLGWFRVGNFLNFNLSRSRSQSVSLPKFRVRDKTSCDFIKCKIIYSI